MTTTVELRTDRPFFASHGSWRCGDEFCGFAQAEATAHVREATKRDRALGSGGSGLSRHIAEGILYFVYVFVSIPICRVPKNASKNAPDFPGPPPKDA